MKKLVSILLLLLSIISNYVDIQSKQNVDFYARYEMGYNSEPYGISLDIAKGDNDEYLMVVDLSLDEGTYYVSPNSKGDYKGRFKIYLPKNNMIDLVGNIIDNPPAEEQIDPWNGGQVSFVNNNTRHGKHLIIKERSDFKVKGVISFVIEPQCTMEVIEFLISQHSGKLDVTRIFRDKC